MSRQYDWPGTIPVETVRVAQAALPKGSVAMGMRDPLGGFVTIHDLDRVTHGRRHPPASNAILAVSWPYI